MALTPNKDKSREGVSGDKFEALGQLLIPDNNKAIVKVDKFTSINIERIQQITGNSINCVILDVDETVAEHHGEILQENIEHIAMMVNMGIVVIINSNMKATSRYDVLKEMFGDRIIIHCSEYSKPSLENYEECLDLVQMHPYNTMMAGDNPLTDGGSYKAGIPFAQVTPIPTRSIKNLHPKRIFQKASRSFYRALSDHFDFLYDRDVIREKDMSFGLRAILEGRLNRELLSSLDFTEHRDLVQKIGANHIGLLNALEKIEQELFKFEQQGETIFVNPELEQNVIDGQFTDADNLAGILYGDDVLKSIKGFEHVSELIELHEIVVTHLLGECKRIQEIISSYQA